MLAGVTAAPLGTILYFFPDPRPFLPPGKWAVAEGTGFLGQVSLADTLWFAAGSGHF